MITTERLELIPGTSEIFSARVDDRESLSRYLGGARVPDEWPPELYDQDAVNWTAKYLSENPDACDWMVWFLVLRPDKLESGERTVIGCCGFKGQPLTDGTCEIGYGVLSQFRRAGYATEAARALISWAFSHPQVTRVIAETYPELRPSISVMEKNGLRFIGDGSEERVIRYELTRAGWERRDSAAS
ncbi:MAG: [ribosomal protein S5]-alanine N-acetyltransferase [Acidobacteriota bacterium]|nr:[ribosomal protein S5]-alanine N-acetyltransferase [Acidobacteriota bacterium]